MELFSPHPLFSVEFITGIWFLSFVAASDTSHQNKKAMKATAAKELKELLKQGWSEAEANEIIAERIERAIRDNLRARIAKLDAMDTTEYGEMKDAAHWNALDTCEHDGLPRDDDSTPYMVAYVATLCDLLDSAGIAVYNQQ